MRPSDGDPKGLISRGMTKLKDRNEVTSRLRCVTLISNLRHVHPNQFQRRIVQRLQIRSWRPNIHGTLRPIPRVLAVPERSAAAGELIGHVPLFWKLIGNG